MTILFLSPHFDDAVLSAGGTISQWVHRGEKVLIRTVMGGVPNPDALPDTPLVRELHARWAAGANPVVQRIVEDENAIHSLGAQTDRMSAWDDCIYRRSSARQPLYATGDDLFGPIHPEDRAGRLLPLVPLPPFEIYRTIYAPLGVGNHVDHQIVRNWGLELARSMPWVALKFYEEYPYTEQEGALERAFETLAGQVPHVHLTPELVMLNEAEIAAKVTAISHYVSQISSFWPSLEAMAAAVRASLFRTGHGSPVERFWRMVV